MENAQLVISEIEKLVDEAEDSNLVALSNTKNEKRRIFLSGRADTLSEIKESIARVRNSVAA